jgi:ATP-binding cassette subfamily B protein
MSNNPKEKKSGKVFDITVLRRIYKFIVPYKYTFYMIIGLTVLLAVVAPIRPYLIQYTIDNHVLTQDRSGLTNMIIFLVALTFLSGIVQFYHTYLSGWLGQKVITDIRTILYKHLLNMKMSFFDKTPIGNLVTRNISDIQTLSEIFTNGLAAIASDVLQLVFILSIMFYTDWKLTLVCLSTLPLMLLSTYVFKEKIKDAFNDVRTAVASLNTFVQEHITGMPIVQIFNSEDRELDKFKEVNKLHLKSNLRAVLYYSVYFPIAEVIGASGIGLLVWYGGKSVIEEEITIGTLIAFIMYMSLFFRPIRMIADRFNVLQLGVVSSERILKLLDNTEMQQQNGTYRPAVLEGNVRFDNVSFAYNNEEYVLQDISFEVKKGQTIALVGATGAGKSSIINLLTRFYEINKGDIFIDGVNLKEYDLDWLREHIGMVLQDVFLFSDNILSNINLGNKQIDKEKILEAAELVGAKDFINELPNGFDYNVMERGATLSVGQRQLISFIRALVYDPKIIILDEATSSVDTETEEMIQTAIESLMKGRTSIVIAHRLATIQKADKIIVLERGRIVETGTHEELLQQKGYYAHLHKLQYKEVSTI